MPHIFVFLPHLANFEDLKRLFHILLLGFYLFSATELKELAKVPVLFQHFFEHKNIDQRMTFMGYLEHHYSDIPHTDNDQERDNQLPFKAQDICAGIIGSPALPPSFGYTLKKAYRIITVKKITVSSDHSPLFAFAGKIWQPPKSLILS